MLTLEKNFTIELCDTYIQDDVIAVIKESGLDEPFDYINAKYFIVAREGDDIIGLVVYGEMQVADVMLPRFLHIIIAPKYKRSKLAYKMLQESENKLAEMGFKIITCFIRFDLPNRDMKIRYARHWRYLKYKEDSLGEYFSKQIL